MIVHSTGTTIFSAKNVPETNKQDSLVIGGIISAFTSVINDITGEPNQSLKCVELEKRVIIAERKEEIIGILIADRKLMILENSLSKFLDEFYKKYSSEIIKFTGDTSLYDEAIDLLPKIFPYLDRNQLVEI